MTPTRTHRFLLAGSDTDLKRDSIYEELLLDIICGALEPGESIDEALIAERYKAGRAGVRDALYRLSLEGLVDRRPRMGTVVASTSFIEMQQIFQLRTLLEGRCAALAAKNARPEHIRAMKVVFRDAEQAIARQDWRSLVMADQAFHHALNSASRNQWLARTITTLHNSALRFWHYSLPRRSVEALRQEIACHMMIAEAVEKHDPEAAQRHMQAVLAEFPSTVQGFTQKLFEEGI